MCDVHFAWTCVSLFYFYNMSTFYLLHKSIWSGQHLFSLSVSSPFTGSPFPSSQSHMLHDTQMRFHVCTHSHISTWRWVKHPHCENISTFAVVVTTRGNATNLFDHLSHHHGAIWCSAATARWGCIWAFSKLFKMVAFVHIVVWLLRIWGKKQGKTVLC